MGEPDAWLVAWDSDGVACRRAYTDAAEAVRWAERMADTEGCSAVTVLPMAVVKDSLTAEPSGNSREFPHPEPTP